MAGALHLKHPVNSPGNRGPRFSSLRLRGETWGSEQPCTAREGGAGSPPSVRAPSTPHICPRGNPPPYKVCGPETGSETGFCWGTPGGGHFWSAACQGLCLLGHKGKRPCPSVPPPHPTPQGGEPVSRPLPFRLLSLGQPLPTSHQCLGGGEGALGGPSLLPRLIMQTWASLFLGLQNHCRW